MERIIIQPRFEGPIGYHLWKPLKRDASNGKDQKKGPSSMGASFFYVYIIKKIVDPSDTNHPFFSPGSLFRNLSTLPWIQHPKQNNAAIKGTGWVRELFTKPKWCASWCTMALCSYGIHRRKKTRLENNHVGNSEKSWDDGMNDMEWKVRNESPSDLIELNVVVSLDFAEWHSNPCDVWDYIQK